MSGALRRLIPLLLLAISASAQTPPARIVSTFPSITETLFALGVGDRVVGVSTYCRYPPAVLALPKVGTYSKPDPEKIALLRPDLVIIDKSATQLADRLAALHIQYARVTGGSLADVYSMIRDIGRAVHRSEQADKLDAAISARLDLIQAESTGKPKPTVLMVVGRNPGLLTNLIAVGPGTYLGQLLEIAGGQNVLTDKGIGYPHISLETVERFNPDIILDLSMMGEATDNAGPQEERLRQPWLARPELVAVQRGMVFGLTSETLVTPGPRVVDAVALIRAKIQTARRP